MQFNGQLPMRFESSVRRNDEERILPLINIVFLLLIFFMLAGRVTGSDPFRIEPPRSVSETDARAREMLVQIGAGGRVALDGEVMEPAAVGAAVTERVSDDATVAVLVKADGRTEARRVVAMMEILRDAGVQRLKLLTLREDR